MRPDVLADAERALPEALRDLDAVLADLEAKTQAAARRQRELRAWEDALAQRERDLEARAARLAGEERAWAEQARERERAAREQARQLLLDARRRIEQALGLARAAVSEATAKAARRLVEEGVQQEADALKKLLAETQRKGWRLRLGSAASEAGSPRGASGPAAQPEAKPIQTASTEVDLRGLTVDEATAALTRALDLAVVEDLPFLRIIHGKGTGALREAVRETLARDRRVAGFRLAPPPEGGSGVTIADLAR
jgi:DNA mismatch repair protein MutS2